MSVFEYKAFISYSHRDARWAQWLLTALETYRLPESKTRGVGRIFRDRDEAGAATDLKDEIQRALLASEHLIVIASPASARSKYVQAEIEAFAEANKTRPIPGRILTLIIDGEPNVSLDAQHERECFPPALRGGVLKPDGTPYEPLAADARPVGDGRTRALAKLVAGLMDIRYDTLVRRDLQRRQRRRLFVGMTTAGALAIAAVVSMVIVSGNVEQANLRTAREAAERDARTVTAVNSAERARRLLESGNRRGAVTLARGSLTSDGTLPFIPQAYSVLYGALFQSGAPLSLELGSAGPDDAITRMLANGDFVSVGGKLAVWSTDGGVSYTREGLSTGSFVALAPDRTALFIKNFPSTGVLRYRPGARGWDLLDDFEAVIQSDILRDAPQTYVAIDNRTLAGCYYETLAVISFPETGDGLGNADLTKELGYSCTVLALTDKQTLLIADDWEGTVREYDLTGEATGRAYATGDTSVLWARAYKDVVIVGAIGNTYAFARETQTLIDSYPETSSPKSVSPAGTIMLESGYSIDATGPVIHDLVAKTKRPLNCQLCSTIGFPDEDTVLMLGEDHRAVLALDIHSGRPKQDLFAFEQRVEEAELLEDGRTVLGIRPSSVSSAVTLDQPSRDVTVVAGPGPYLVQAKFAGPDTVVTQVAQGSNVPMQTVLHLYRAEPRGAEISSPDLVVPGGVSQIDRLPNDLFSVFDGDSIFSVEGPLRVFDAETGKLVFRKDLRTPARSFADGRFLLVADGTEFGVFDTQTREYGPIDAGAGIDALTVWSVMSNALTVIRDKTAKVFTLDDKGAQLRNSFTLATPPLIACLAEDARTLYLYDFSQEQPFLAKVTPKQARSRPASRSRSRRKKRTRILWTCCSIRR